MLEIEFLEEEIPVYDFTIAESANFFANDILVHNCTEIFEVSTPDETAVCTLASISLPSCLSGKKGNLYFNFNKLSEITKILVENLNKVIDIGFYPTEAAKKSNFRHRPIGLGVQGLADVFAKMKFPFDSDNAKELNKNIFETIYFSALNTSCDLAIKNGKYETFDGSPASQGILQFDMWGVEPEMYNWDSLKQKIKENGLRNSLLLAPMPTASCQSGENEILDANFNPISLYSLMDQQNIDWKRIEQIDQQMTIPFEKDVFVQTKDGLKKSPGIHYNGYKDVIEIEFEDGKKYKFTNNHLLLVKSTNGEIWKRVDELTENDEIVSV